MKKILVPFVAFAICSPSFAHSDATISGKVLDSSDRQPAGWATVALIDRDSTIVAGTTCSEQGEFELHAKAGHYTIVASLIGYKDAVLISDIREGANELPPIGLDPDARMIEGAKITENVKLVEMKIDKLVMNVSESAFAKGSNGLELLKKAPGVTIDKDGNVKLNGQSVSVWIDGRPSYLDGKSLESLLRGTDSDGIEKIEIMEHPSAKYDAAGQGGIINIRTKRNLLQGLNGTLGINVGGMLYDSLKKQPWEQSHHANLAYRSKKTNSFLNLSQSHLNMPVTVSSELTAGNLTQNACSELVSYSHDYNVKFGSDWFVNDRNTLGFIVTVPGSYETFSTADSHTEQSIGGQPAQSIVSNISNGPNRTVRHNVNLNYTHIFDQARASELTANLDYYRNLDRQNNCQTDIVDGTRAMFTSIVTDQKYDIWSAKVDYQSVVWNMFMFESGAKWALSITDSDNEEAIHGTPAQSHVIYSENIGAAYANLAGQLGAKFSFKGGLRAEYTNRAGSIDGTVTDYPDYLDFFPTVYAGYTPTQMWRLSASYTRRIQRPGYYSLNPVKTLIDAKTYIMGKTDIKPQYSDQIGLGAGYGQHLSLSLAYVGTKDQINQVPAIGEDGTQILTFDNSGTQNLVYGAFNVAALPIGKILQWTLSVAAMDIRTQNTPQSTPTRTFGTNAYTDFTFILPKGWKVDLDGWASSPMRLGYYQTHGMFQANFAAKKNMLQDRMVLSVKLDDIFRTAANDIDIYDPSGAVSRLKQTYYQQKLILGLTWNFGKAQKPLRSRNVGNIDEESRMGSSSGIGGGADPTK